jgi:hypothetical protein
MASEIEQLRKELNELRERVAVLEHKEVLRKPAVPQPIPGLPWNTPLCKGSGF